MKCEGAPVFQPRPRLDWQLQLASPQVHFHHFNLTRRRTVWGGKWDYWEKELMRRKVGEGTWGERVWPGTSLKARRQRKRRWRKSKSLEIFYSKISEVIFFFLLFIFPPYYLSCTVACKTTLRPLNPAFGWDLITYKIHIYFNAPAD